MDETHISATDLASNLLDVLNRARHGGESLVIERDGEPLAMLGPIHPKAKMTLGEFFQFINDRGLPDEEYARDLEAIQAEQPKAETIEWPC